jgi:biotin synthase
MDMSTEEEMITSLKEKVLAGEDISREEALFLSKADLTLLSQAADEIREAFFQDDFDMCAIISAKNGKCSENCRFCSQACVSKAEVVPKPLVTTEELNEVMGLRDSQHVRRFCVVSVGRKMADRELDQLCESLKAAHEGKQIALCASLGLLDEQQFIRLKEAGVTRVHNNLETSERFFPTVCTSHTYQEKIETVRAAKRAGLEVCCGGIFGVGETMEDRIDMALAIRKLDVQSVPINMLDPVPGTDCGDRKPLTKEEVQRIIALYRFLLPKVYVRLAAGRSYLDDGGASCFHAGCNATITGDMLTVQGVKVTVEEDLEEIRGLGYTL